MIIVTVALGVTMFVGDLQMAIRVSSSVKSKTHEFGLSTGD